MLYIFCVICICHITTNIIREKLPFAKGKRLNIKVQYLGPIRAMLNKREEEVEISLKTTVYELLRKLSDIYGKGFENEVFEDDGKNIRDGLIVTINGKAIGQLSGIRTGLKGGDIITLLPLFAGGG